MSTIRMFALLAVALPLSAGSALAGPTKPGATKPISFEEMKARCERPRDFDEQIQPEDLSITCTDVSRSWIVPKDGGAGEVPLTANRQVTAAVFSRKWSVAPVQAAYPVAQKAGSCPRFHEVESTVSIDVKIGCSDLTKMDDASQFCAAHTDAAKGGNSKLVDTHETGNVIDTCGQAAVKADPK